MSSLKVGRIAGALVLAGVVAAAWYYEGIRSKLAELKQAQGDGAKVTLVVGGEKVAFLRNPAVLDLLGRRYGLTVDATKAGSMEMVAAPAPGVDALWPSNQVAAELFRTHGGTWVAKENIFGSPVVFYAWDQVAEALEKQGIASREGESRTLDIAKLAAALRDEKSWADVGLPELYGKVKVSTTDPLVSNSGNMFAALLATVWSGGEVPDDGSIDAVLPPLQKYFRRMGAMEKSSADLFANFLQQGAGARPLIVSYENQLVEFALAHPEAQQLLRERIRTLYPTPTIWGEHPLIALTANGRRLVEALKDPEIQRIAWEQHGFRSGLLGVQNDPKILRVTGIPENVRAVMPMPSAGVMDKVARALAN